jgi:hypothetical protein
VLANEPKKIKALNPNEKRPEVVFAFFEKREGVGCPLLFLGDVRALSIASM